MILWLGIGLISIIFLIWSLSLTVFTLRLSAHYNRLIKDVNKRSLQSVLEGMLENIAASKKDIETLQKTCDTIIADGKVHIQKIGLLRFNPFKDTGGDQSFILALTDGHDTGVVISGLYSRSGTRWYAKQIIKGKGVEHELSNEEQEAVKKAKVLAHEK